MERVITDAVVHAVAKEVAQRLHEDFTASWGVVITELAKTRESNEQLQGKMVLLESKVNGQNTELTQLLTGLREDLQRNRTAQRKASQVLDSALKEMGLTGDGE